MRKDEARSSTADGSIMNIGISPNGQRDRSSLSIWHGQNLRGSSMLVSSAFMGNLPIGFRDSCLQITEKKPSTILCNYAEEESFGNDNQGTLPITSESVLKLGYLSTQIQ